MLDDDELVRQFIDVVSSYQLIGIKIHGIVSDGGGGNTKFFHMISEYKPLKDKWIKTNLYVQWTQLTRLDSYRSGHVRHIAFRY